MATTDRDYYELLGVPRSADEQEIKKAFRRLARELGREPAERATDYRILRTFPDPREDPREPLEQITDPQARFGSYHDLIAEQRFRFRDFHAEQAGNGAAGGD